MEENKNIICDSCNMKITFAQYKEKIDKVISILFPESKDRIYFTLGLDRKDGPSLEEICKKYSVTRERSRQIREHIEQKSKLILLIIAKVIGRKFTEIPIEDISPLFYRNKELILNLLTKYEIRNLNDFINISPAIALLFEDEKGFGRKHQKEMLSLIEVFKQLSL